MNDWPAPIMPLDQLRALPSDPPQSNVGIYFLWAGAILLYIGLSESMKARLNRHTLCRDGYLHGKAVPFRRHTCLAWRLERHDGLVDGRQQGRLRELERLYIRTYLPPYNVQIR